MHSTTSPPAPSQSRTSDDRAAFGAWFSFSLPGLAHAAQADDVASRLRHANALVDKADLLAAQDAYVRALDLDPGNLDALLSLSAMCRFGGHLVEAIDLAEHAHQHHPGEPDVLAALATLAIDVGDAYGAQRLLVHLTRANRNHPERMVQLRRLAELRGAARQAANQQQVAA